MLKNRMKALAEKKFDNSVKVEVIKDNELLKVRGGMSPDEEKICGELTSCNINSDDCPKLKSCGWN
ncbi:hypothetical protein PG630_03725 [Riemerella anatipestifer]|nr:hypothetical protein [Riemerella anatipestifer]